jgi:signal transduction histidine kinase
VDFPIRKSIENVMNIIEQTLKNNNIELKLDIDEGARLKGYLNEYNQVILNLVSNAKDAILNKNVKNPWIKIRAFPEGGRIVLTVSDNAGGINDNIIDKIFDPYFTTKIDGTGIGLYMSKIIIENNMGGELTAKNLGEGAEFRISV